jgi:pimeloyl-ACP methyl ester carboxylesterase
VLLLRGGDADRSVPLAQSRAMTVVNRSIRLKVVRGAGHWLTEEQFDKVWPDVLRFLKYAAA